MNGGLQPMQYVLGALFGSVGGGLVLAALWLVGANTLILRTYEHAPGVVVSSQRIGPSSAKGSTFGLQVRYQGARGSVTASADRTFFSFDVGEPVEVYYRADEPWRIVVNSFRTLWFTPTIVGVIGLILEVQALRLLFAGRAPEGAVLRQRDSSRSH